MSFEDFKYFVNFSGIMGENLGDRDINNAYNLAMMTQIDEISNSRYI